MGELEAGRLPLGRAYVPTQHQAMIREAILLLKRGYLETDYFQNKFGVDIWDHFRDVWQGYVDEGWVQPYEPGSPRIELTTEGLLRVDGLLTAFFEPEHQGVRYT